MTVKKVNDMINERLLFPIVFEYYNFMGNTKQAFPTWKANKTDQPSVKWFIVKSSSFHS